MPKLSSMRPEIQHPFTILTTIFVLWKAALILIVVASPAPGYDTSTTLLDWQGGHSLLAKFVRWDAIYFTQIAQHGHVFEQEWAWGIGYSSILRWTTRGTCLRHHALGADLYQCCLRRTSLFCGISQSRGC